MMGKVRCIAASDAKAPEAVSHVKPELLDKLRFSERLRRGLRKGGETLAVPIATVYAAWAADGSFCTLVTFPRSCSFRMRR